MSQAAKPRKRWKLAKSCCVIPVSNADPERVFSVLKKIQTEMRSELNNDTICSLMCVKQNQDISCFQYEPSDNLLKTAKQAVLTYQSSLKAIPKKFVKVLHVNKYMHLSLFCIYLF